MIVKTDFKDGEIIPKKYTLDGENINPEIEILEIPTGAKTVALIMDDPDAKRVCGFTWIHWIVYNIKVESAKLVIRENSVPGIQIENSSSEKYGGPSPPSGSGVHNYYFKFYALDEVLDGGIDSLDELNKEIDKHKLDFVQIVGKYSR